MTGFSRFVAIDWSGAKGSRHRAIQVAFCRPGDNPPLLLTRERAWSRTEVAGWLAALAARGERALVGVDASLSLPWVDARAYFPEAHDNPADARSLWREIAARSAPDPDLGAQTYLASRQRWFWTGKLDGPKADRARLRVCEALYRERGLGMPESCFVLVGARQVAKSSLTLMRLLAGLNGFAIWPFDRDEGQAPVFLEIYCQVFAKMAGFPGKLTSADALRTALVHPAIGSRPLAPAFPATFPDHVGDVLISAAGLRAIASDPTYWNPADLTPQIADTEGWTFGVR